MPPKRKRARARPFKFGPAHRYVYIMMKTSNRSAYAKATLQREYKIGIAKDPKSRNERVDKAVTGKVKLITTRQSPDALSLEKKLHRMFADSRFRIKTVAKGGGETEWFYMTDIEYVALEAAFWTLWAEQLVKPIFFALIGGILLFSYAKKTINEANQTDGGRPRIEQPRGSDIRPQDQEIPALLRRPVRGHRVGEPKRRPQRSGSSSREPEQDHALVRALAHR